MSAPPASGATLAPKDPEPRAPAGAGGRPSSPACCKCLRPAADSGQTVCPHCGWYAVGGVFVEIEQAWEEACSGDPAPADPQRPVWANLVPAWVWLAAASLLAAIAISVTVRLLVVDVAWRSAWAVTQLLASLGVAAALHVSVFIAVATDDADLGVGDLVVSPLKAWRRLLMQMPRRQWLLDGFAFAAAGAIGAAAIIGGIPYDRLWDWGLKAPPKQNLLKAIAETAGGKGDQSMEEAMDEFAAGAAVTGGSSAGGAQPAPETTPAPARETTDALILGYTLNGEGGLDEVLLAAEWQGELVYAGRLRPGLSPDDALPLLRRLRANEAAKPLVPTSHSGRWVRPRFPCRVSYTERLPSGRLRGLEWEELLTEIGGFW